MKKKSFISIIVVSVFLLSSISVIALAGTEPSPFKPHINQLGAVENVLDSVKNRVEKVLSKPVDYSVSGASLKGTINRLEAIIEQLLSLDDKIFSIVEEILDVDPSLFHPRSEVVPALENVRDAAQSIVDSFDVLPVAKMPDESIWTVEDVQESAQDVADNTQSYINLFSDFTIDCDSITIKSECEEEPSCDWVFSGFDPADPGHCENAP
jgi:methyl-accepting chemotaxis protein